MDDPWGSAGSSSWAAAPTSPLPSLPAPAVLTRDRPAPLRLLLAPPGQTPWDEDDVFGARGSGAGCSPGGGDFAAAVWAGTVSGRTGGGGCAAAAAAAARRSSLSRGTSPGATPDPWGGGGKVSPNPSDGWGELGVKERGGGYALRRSGGDDRDDADERRRVSGLVAMYDGLSRKWSFSTRHTKSRASSIDPRESRDSREAMPPLPEIALPVPVPGTEHGVTDKPREGEAEQNAEEDEGPDEQIGDHGDHETAPSCDTTTDDPSAASLASTSATSVSVVVEPPAAAAKPPPPRRVVDIAFPVDPANFDLLFPDLADPELEPEPRPMAAPIALPSHDPRDSFKTMGESRMWYRISRHGSMRKHASATSDEGYRRVAWAGSAVREDAVGTVRRWLEEGSHSGTVMGGNFRGANKYGGVGMFNWDSTERPLSFSELFHQSPRGAAAAGAAAPNPTPPTMTQPSPAVAPAAQFAWSTAGQYSPVSPCAEPIHSPRSPKYRSTSVTHPSMRPGGVAPPTPVSAARDDNDDSEWGEMVSSPTAGAGEPTKVSGLGDWGGDKPDGGGLRLAMATPSPRQIKAPPARPELATWALSATSRSSAADAPWQGEIYPKAEKSAVPVPLDPLEEEMARRMIDQLPDMSYMLR